MALPAEKFDEFAAPGEEQYLEIDNGIDSLEDGFELEVEQELQRERIERVS